MRAEARVMDRQRHDERCGYAPLETVNRQDVTEVYCICTKCGSGWTERHPLADQVERLRAAILDIDAHASGLGEDEDGFVSGGYVISVGSLHRALGVVGHSSRKCRLCTGSSCGCAEEHLRAESADRMLRKALVQFAEWCGAEIADDTANYELASIIAEHLTGGAVVDWGAKNGGWV